jgi:cell volume regulation protein A
VTGAGLLLLYAFVEQWHGSGPIAVLLFGILVTESKRLPKWIFLFGQPPSGLGREEAHATVQWFHKDVTFLVRTFFFVYLGLLLEAERLTAGLVWASIGLGAAIVVGRWATPYLLRIPLREHSLWLVGAFIPRGLVSAVLAALPIQHGILGAEQLLELTIPVILLTNELMAAGLLARPKGA